jgi:hypothetical protein
MVRVRGCAKVMTHLMFGVIALTSDHPQPFFVLNQKLKELKS